MKYLLFIAGAVGLAHMASRKTGIKSILFVGDSNTALPFSYAYKIQSRFPAIRTKIIAKIGAQTGWMMDELKKELKSGTYDAVCVLGGSNDIYATDSIEKAKGNLFSMYAAASNSGAVVVGISPPNKNFYTKRTEKRQQLLGQLILWIGSNRMFQHYINFWGITNNKTFFTATDGFLHAQAPAHEILAGEVISALQLK
jgi:hypothetical protein